MKSIIWVLSHVAVSFDGPEYTADVDGLGTLRLLEAIRFLGLTEKNFIKRLHQNFMGRFKRHLRQRRHLFIRESPYAVAKIYAYWITVIIAKLYGMYACNGICSIMKSRDEVKRL